LQKHYNLILLFILSISCTGLPVKNKFAVKDFGKDGTLVEIPYWSSKNGEQHCFQNQDQREIITVEWMDLKLALDHFYKRTASVQLISNFESPSDLPTREEASSILMNYTEGSNHKIEVADCTYYHLKPFFGDTVETYYISFRIKK
jgi:hypothetical protein